MVRIGMIFFCLTLTACVSLNPIVPEEPRPAYIPQEEEESLLCRFAPIFVLQSSRESFDRIGRPVARWNGEGREEEIVIDPDQAVMYVKESTFSTARGQYTNLVYRVHFEKVPYSLIPFHITAGKNGGLMVVLTLDRSNRPLLVTTVHTCGCYRTIVPTTALPREAFPANWSTEKQVVWGETLPGIIDFPGDSPDRRLLVYLHDNTHRVMDLRVMDEKEVLAGFSPLSIRIEPMSNLLRLPLEDGSTTSFFETEGWREGYVKGVFKPWEMLLMSWWALDFNVGVDKEYGDLDKDGTRFYTSLKPWRREESDMEDFAEFLTYWGWSL